MDTKKPEVLVKEIMTKNVKTITSNSSVTDAAKRMKKAAIGALPVNALGENIWVGETMGMITDRDIVLRVVAEDKDPALTEVNKVMTPAVFCCRENESIEKAAEIMAEKKVHRLIVLSENDFVTGILSVGDFAVKVGNAELTLNLAKTISEYVKSKNK
jgi:CBS domain-containing protein